MALLRSAVLGAAALAVLALATDGSARERPPEYEVKAAYLYKLSLFVQWPQEAFGDSAAPVVVGVLGRDPFGDALDRTLAGKHLRGRPFELRRYARPEDLEFCHILFFGEHNRSRVRQVLAQLKGKSTLTMGENDDFLADGGVLQFLTKQGTVRFRISNETARLAGLNISAKLLQLSE